VLKCIAPYLLLRTTGHNASGAWSARQLYYVCDENRPRIYDQDLAGFVMGTDDPSLGYVSIVRLPADAAQALLSHIPPPATINTASRKRIDKGVSLFHR